MKSTIHRADLKRMAEQTMADAIANTSRGGTQQSPLAGPIFTAPPDPKACSTCGKKGLHITLVVRGEWECSHLECALRKNLTATKGVQP